MCSLVFGAVWCLTLFFTATSLQTNDEKDERRPPIPGFIGPKTVRNTAEEIIALRERRRGFAEPMIQPTAPRRASMLVAKRFLPLFLVQALGAFNDNVYRFAMIGLITFQLSAQLAMSIAALGTIAGGIFILPFALFAPIAGEIADRIDKAMEVFDQMRTQWAGYAIIGLQHRIMFRVQALVMPAPTARRLCHCRTTL